MKKSFQLLIFLFTVLLAVPTFAQKSNFSTSTVITNSTFNNLDSWTRSNTTYIREHNNMVVTRGGDDNSNIGTASRTLSQEINNIPVSRGHVYLKFGIRLFKGGNGNGQHNISNNYKPKLVVKLGGVEYFNITRTVPGNTYGNNNHLQTSIVKNELNGASIVAIDGNFTNSSNGALTYITLKIPRTNTTGNLAFEFSRAMSSSYSQAHVALDDVYFLEEKARVFPTANNCVGCLPIDNSGIVADAAPIATCNQEQLSGLYEYYLPAVAAMPTGFNVAVSGIQLTTEVPQATVFLYRPDNSLVTSYIVTASQMIEHDTRDEMFASNTNSTYNDKGYIVKSDQPLTVRWHLSSGNNLISVVTRGKQALGKAFRLSSIMHAYRNNNQAGSSSRSNSPNDITATTEGNHFVTIMATENNTRVQLALNDTAVHRNSFEFVTLNAGQQFTRVYTTQSLAGRLVLADKPIAVMSGQQHKRIMMINGTEGTSTSSEGSVVQVAPIYTLGKEYLIINTRGYSGYQVIATEDATVVSIGGVIKATLDAGQAYQYFVKHQDTNTVNDPYVVSVSKPAYVYNIGANAIGEYELFPSPAVDQPLGKGSLVYYSASQGEKGWVIVANGDVAKLKRNGQNTLDSTLSITLAGTSANNGKRLIYWDEEFAPLSGQNKIECNECEYLFVGQLNDLGGSGAQVGYFSSFNSTPIQFYNSDLLPNQILTSGYVFDTLNYYRNNRPSTLTHTITEASSAGGLEIDEIFLARANGRDYGSVANINGLTFTLNTPSQQSVDPNDGMDQIFVTAVLKDDAGQNATVCLSYMLDYFETLPVTLLSFDAKKQASTAVLSWSTSNERDNKGFTIQKSKNGSDWQDIAWINSNASEGNSDIKNDYTYVDKSPYSGHNFYRLQQADFSGQTSLSQVRLLEFDQIEQKYMIYPNPTEGKVTIDGLAGNETLMVHGMSGQVLVQENIQNTKYTVDLSNLSAGVYLIQIINIDGTIHYERIVKN